MSVRLSCGAGVGGLQLQQERAEVLWAATVFDNNFLTGTRSILGLFLAPVGLPLRFASADVPSFDGSRSF
jgi:hypothetical protein